MLIYDHSGFDTERVSYLPKIFLRGYSMSVERIVLAFAGLMVLLSLGLGVTGSPIFHHGNWLWFRLFYFLLFLG